MTLQYRVPTDVQREDQILWFVTLKQLVIVMIGGGISYMMYVNLTKTYILNELQHILIWIPAAISVAVAFLKIRDLTMTQFVAVLLETSFFRNQQRRWGQHGGTPLVSMTTTVTTTSNKKKKAVAEQKDPVTAEKIQNLARIMDNPNMVKYERHE